MKSLVSFLNVYWYNVLFSSYLQFIARFVKNYKVVDTLTCKLVVFELKTRISTTTFMISICIKFVSIWMKDDSKRIAGCWKKLEKYISAHGINPYRPDIFFLNQGLFQKKNISLHYRVNPSSAITLKKYRNLNFYKNSVICKLSASKDS